MQALRRHIEKILLGFFLLVVVGVSFLLLLDLKKAKQITTPGLNPRPNKGGAVPALTEGDFTAIARLASPEAEWRTRGGARSNPFIPGAYSRCVNPACTYWFPASYNVCPFCKTEQPVVDDREPSKDDDRDGDGIPDAVEAKYPFLDPDLKRDGDLDQDSDGFTNREEIMGAKTDPASPDSHPLLVTHVRLHDIVKDRFGILFESLMTGGETTPSEKWDIVLKVRDDDGQWKSRFAKLGQVVAGYKVVEARPKTKEAFDESVKANVKQDVSELVLQKEGEPPITLVRREPQWSGVAFRLIQYLSPRQRRQFVVKSGETLTLADLQGHEEKYTVTQNADGRIVAQLQNGKADAPRILIVRGPSPYPTEERNDTPPGGPGTWPGAMGPGTMGPDGGPMMPAPLPVVPRK